MNAALRKAATNAANYIRRNGFGHDQEERIAEIEAALAEPGNPLEEAIRQTQRDIASAGMLPAAAQLAAILPLQSHLRDLLEQRAQLLAHPVYVVEGSVGKLLEVGLVKTNGLGKASTFRSLYSMVQHEAEEKAAVRLDQQRAQERPVPPVPGATPQPVAAPARPIDPLTLLSDLAEDARKIGHGLQVLADRLDNVALAVAAKIEDAGTADQKLQQMRQQFKALLGEDA
ncbi:MAG: hypothetical protein KAX74_05545 [Sphaerotilus sp.]|nr:hypothetical protein [Sphaerotilus sp.]